MASSTVDSFVLRRGIAEMAATIGTGARDAMVEALRKAAPVSTPTPTSRGRPGTLRDSIRPGFTEIGRARLRFNVHTDVEYASYTEEGTRAHVIRARNVRLLRFWWEKGPHGPDIYFFPWVNWKPGPGVAANRKWWSKVVTQRRWSAQLSARARSTTVRA